MQDDASKFDELKAAKLVEQPDFGQVSGSSTSDLDPLIGQTIAGRLEIISKIGAGGMSAVYKARHILLDKTVAVKVIKAGARDEKALLRFRQEAKAATALSHPNIAGVREFGIDEGGYPYLVMDFVDGLSLAAVLKNEGRLSDSRVRLLVSQLCSGLAHAHKLGIVHRDLKPANIIITSLSDGSESVRIVDFGIAKVLEDAQGHVTQTGEVFGTPHYMSPEQGLGQAVDARSDIYSVGCLMYECLTGQVPFQGNTALEILMKHANQTVPPFSAASVKSELEPVVLCCMEKEPKNRYQSAEELERELQDLQLKQWSTKRIRKAAPAVTKKLLFGVGSAFFMILVLVIFMLWPIFQTVFFAPPWTKLMNEGASQAAVSNWDNAKRLYRKAIIAADRGNASDKDKEGIYEQLGRVYTANQDWNGSVSAFSKAVEFNSKHAPDNKTGSLHDWLGDALTNDGKFDEAIEHLEFAVQVKSKVLGAEHPHTLFAMFHLGQAYRKAGRLDDAESVDQKCLSLAQKIYPNEDDASLADAYHQLANIQADKGRVDEAVGNYRKSLELSERIRGGDDKATLKERDWLISYLAKHGRSKDAAQIEKQYPASK